MCYSKERIQNKSAKRWAFFQYKMKSSCLNKMIMSKTDFGSVTKAKIISTVGALVVNCVLSFPYNIYRHACKCVSSVKQFE